MLKSATLALAVALASSSFAQTTYRIDTAASKLTWTGTQITGSHTGNIAIRSGSTAWGTDGLTRAEISIDMTSIVDTDMGREWASDLESHLMSADFFDSNAFKTATFSSTKVEKLAAAAPDGPNYTVTGDLTIKGITKPVTFSVLASSDAKGMRAKGSLTFDRTAYDVTARSGSFFKGLGDRMIDDKVELSFTLIGR